ncbi:MAG: hypothetical protein GF388_07900 [Candidatus Aegiribacteria sp.]|nr:hypothetical protein [Candidatus Aegiribacteria sp.]
MDKWLDELDSELLSIRNQFGQIYYQGFLTGNLDADRISELSAKRKSLLEQSDILERLTSISAKVSSENWSVNAHTRRAFLLQDLLIAERIEGAPILVSSKAAIQKQENEFIPSIGSDSRGYTARRNALSSNNSKQVREEAHSSLSPLLSGIESNCREFIEIANTLSKEQGYSDYFDFRLSQGNLNPVEVNQDLEAVLKVTEEEYLEFLCLASEVTGTETVDFCDLLFAQNSILSELDQIYSGTNPIFNLKKLLETLDINMDTFPVSIESADTSNAGACFSLGSDDIRLILGGENGYFGHYIAFHEFGHALHYSLQPKSVLLSDNGLCLEVMADFFTSFLADPSWLGEYTLANESEITRLLELKRLSDSYRLRTFVLDTMFEREIYRSPGKPLETIWRKLTQEILLVPDKEAIWDPFCVYRPAYTKNYLYSHFLSKRLAVIRFERYGSLLDNPMSLRQIFVEITEFGNLYPFNERMKKVGLDSIKLAEHIDL